MGREETKEGPLMSYTFLTIWTTSSSSSSCSYNQIFNPRSGECYDMIKWWYKSNKVYEASRANKYLANSLRLVLCAWSPNQSTAIFEKQELSEGIWELLPCPLQRKQLDTNSTSMASLMTLVSNTLDIFHLKRSFSLVKFNFLLFSGEILFFLVSFSLCLVVGGEGGISVAVDLNLMDGTPNELLRRISKCNAHRINH